jgi:hypothetical protein
MIHGCGLGHFLRLVVILCMTSGGLALLLPVPSHHRQFRWCHHQSECYEKDKRLSNYEETGSSAKGIVSVLTDLVNMFLVQPDKEESLPIGGKYSHYR